MLNIQETSVSYWKVIWDQFTHHRLGMIGLIVVVLFCLVGVYAPFLASSKPLIVYYENNWYFPLFRYLVYAGFYTKRLDLFFNLLIFTLPCMGFALWFGKKYRWELFAFVFLMQLGAFIYFAYGFPKDPAADILLSQHQQQGIQQELSKNESSLPSWNAELSFMSPYAKLNLLLRYQQRKEQQKRLKKYEPFYFKQTKHLMPTLWQVDEDNYHEELERETKALERSQNLSQRNLIEAKIAYTKDRKIWLEVESSKLRFEVMPLITPFHWEDDAGGDQSLNKIIDFWDLTRINRKDLVAALIFGVRISLVVGIISVGLALLIGIPIGAFAGFYGGSLDIVICRLMEVWESMPTFFMLLMVVAVTQSKSIFLVIAVIGIFGWTGFSRYIRGEFFKQRNLYYVESCRALGFNDLYIIFRHILPNAIPPLLTLLPFAVMGAITSEAGLSFLGLGEEESCSWGVLMDEGRSAFPGEGYLLWPPAILLTLLLVAIALVGDALRDSLDPKMHRISN